MVFQPSSQRPILYYEINLCITKNLEIQLTDEDSLNYGLQRLAREIYIKSILNIINMQPQNQYVFPFVYGSLAFSMGKKTDTTSQNTHKWICYVRGVNNEDLSYLIRKVQFVLHSSFDQPIKPVDKPPFEVKKQGWGQFQILIRIYFQHPNMPHIEVPHMLKLHHTHTSGAQAAKKPLCSQVYDEIVFTQYDEYIEKMIKGRENAMKLDGSNEMENMADQGETVNPEQPLKSISNYSKYLTDLKPDEHKNKLNDALNYILFQIKSLEQKMKTSDKQLQTAYDEIYSNLP